MRFGFRYVLLVVFSLIVTDASTASAQNTSWGELAVSAVRLDFDLSGVGNAPGLAVRATRHLSANVSLEFGGLFTKPNQQFGPSTLFMPEAQLRYRWNAGRVSPHVGGGLGAAMVTSPFHTNWDPTMSVAAGTSVRLTDHLSAVGEFRLRGHEWRFTGTTTELAAGLAWRFPSF